MNDKKNLYQDRAERMVFSPERLGVGWPIKAGFALFVTVPFAMAVCCITWLVRRVRSRGRKAD